MRFHSTRPSIKTLWKNICVLLAWFVLSVEYRLHWSAMICVHWLLEYSTNGPMGKPPNPPLFLFDQDFKVGETIDQSERLQSSAYGGVQVWRVGDNKWFTPLNPCCGLITVTTDCHNRFSFNEASWLEDLNLTIFNRMRCLGFPRRPWSLINQSHYANLINWCAWKLATNHQWHFLALCNC